MQEDMPETKIGVSVYTYPPVLSANICNLTAGTEVKCLVSAFTSTEDTFYEGPTSGYASTITYQECK